MVLLEHVANVNFFDETKNAEPALYVAVKGDSEDVVRILLGHGADPKLKFNSLSATDLVSNQTSQYFRHLVEMGRAALLGGVNQPTDSTPMSESLHLKKSAVFLELLVAAGGKPSSIEEIQDRFDFVTCMWPKDATFRRKGAGELEIYDESRGGWISLGTFFFRTPRL